MCVCMVRYLVIWSHTIPEDMTLFHCRGSNLWLWGGNIYWQRPLHFSGPLHLLHKLEHVWEEPCKCKRQQQMWKYLPLVMGITTARRNWIWPTLPWHICEILSEFLNPNYSQAVINCLPFFSHGIASTSHLSLDLFKWEVPMAGIETNESWTWLYCHWGEEEGLTTYP